MRKLLYTTTALALAAGAARAQTVITPGSGSLTDAAGNVWLITAGGSIQENGQWTPGGGGTAALAIVNGTVYGLDATGKGWFTLSGNSRYWSASAAPAGVAVPSVPASATQSRAAQTVPTGSSAQTTPPAGQTTTASSTPTSAATAPPVTTCAATAGGAASGGFTTSNGNILAPDGSVYIAKGINLYDSAIGSASRVLADFPGLNFIRLAAYSYSDTSSYLSGFISQMSAKGVVVEIEHHIAAGGGVPALTGSDLAAENAWFQELASAFKGNPYVWFGTINEPASGGGLAAEQASNYQTIRGTGNNTILMISEPVQADTSSMTNVVADQHFYGWTSGYSTDQTTVNSNLSQTIGTDRQLTTASGKLPLIIGETGPSTNGTTPDPNGSQVLTADMSSGYGAAFWNWDSEAPQDNLTQNGQMTSYGQTVAGWIALVANAPASVWATGCATSAAAAPATGSATTPASGAVSVTVASAGTPGTADTSQQTTTAAATPETTALDGIAAAQADASNAAIAAADAQAPAVAATVQQANAAGARANAGLAAVLAAMQQGSQGQ
nr:cellulase family glycosylhydrolase [uncultured Rhodopila sp.]